MSITEGSVDVVIEEYIPYVPVNAILADTDSGVVSGTTPIPPEGLEPGTYVIRWIYDPDGSQGITGQNWYASSGVSFVENETEFTQSLATLYANEGLPGVKAYIDGLVNAWDARGAFITWALRSQTLETLESAGCVQFG